MKKHLHLHSRRGLRRLLCAALVVLSLATALVPAVAASDLDGGLTGLLHVSQISKQRIKHPGVVLQEGQKVTVKIIGVNDGKISLSMKALEVEEEVQEEEVFDYKETGAATTGLGALLKGLKL